MQQIVNHLAKALRKSRVTEFTFDILLLQATCIALLEVIISGGFISKLIFDKHSLVCYFFFNRF